MKAAREGKRVKRENESCWHFWDRERDRLSREPDKTNCAINAGHLDARWEIEQPPPREYTFIEAVEMMKAGKKMRPTIVIENGCEFSAIDGWFHYENPQLGHKRRFSHLCVEWITSPWVQA
jgi:hypothetical protein